MGQHLELTVTFGTNCILIGDYLMISKERSTDGN